VKKIQWALAGAKLKTKNKNMIREIINFTKDLIEDIPDIMEWKVKPSKGLHVFIDINDNSQWINQNLQKGKDFDYYDGKNQDIPLWNDCIRYQEVSNYISMNKVQKFDSKQKIHSCSPFAVAFNFNFNNDDKKKLGIRTFKKGEKPTEEEKTANDNLIREKRTEIIKTRLTDYKKNALKMYPDIDEKFNYIINAFYIKMQDIFNAIQSISEYNLLVDKDYLRIYLRTIPYESQKLYYAKYLKSEIFNDKNLSYKGAGVIGFQTTFAGKKPFLKHKTSSLIKGINQRYSENDALVLNNFEKLLKRKVTINKKNFKCLPNPLPIVVDKREINKEIVKLFNESSEPLNYRKLLISLFENKNLKYLSDYYLMNYSNTMSGILINDIDFVPLFRYHIEYDIYNCTELKKDGSKIDSYKKTNIFQLEDSLSSLFLKYNNKTKHGDKFLFGNYFATQKELDDKKVFKGYTVKSETLSSFFKYRKSIYEYIYKSRVQSITSDMFDDMVYSAVLSDMSMDEYKNERHSKFYPISEKINIWFSLYNLFNNKKENNMASKVTDLMSKMRSVAKGDTNIETPEEFAFGAGQLVSYLIDRSVAANKTYAMLEPYLQKNKSNQLQDAIAQTIAVYKHGIKIYKGKFEQIASQVLTDNSNVEMKPLLKYLLAGCFCPCIIYDKKVEDKNNNN